MHGAPASITLDPHEKADNPRPSTTTDLSLENDTVGVFGESSDWSFIQTKSPAQQLSSCETGSIFYTCI